MTTQSEIFYENSVAATIINIEGLGTMETTMLPSGICVRERILAQLEREHLQPADRALFQFAANQIEAGNLHIFAEKGLQAALQKRIRTKQRIEKSVLERALTQIQS